MKINEIATRHLNEAPPIVKYVGPYFDKAAAKLFGVGKGTTQAAAPASADLGGIKAADPLVSNAERAALGILPPPERSSLSSFFKRRGDTGFDPNLNKTQALPDYLQNMPPASIGSPPKPKPRPDTSAADREVRNRHNMNPRMPNKGKPSAEAEAFAAEKAARAEKQAAEELAAAERQASGAPADFEPPMSANAPAPAAAPAAAAAEPAADTVTLPRDIVDRIMRMAERDPVAAEEAAKKFGIPWKSILAGGAAIGALQGGNALYPDTIPSAGQLIDKGVTKLSTLTADPDGAGPPPGERAYDFKTNDSDSKTSEKSSSDAPPASNIDDIKDTDAYKKALKQALDGEKIDESTAALNRMVYLSRL